MRSGYEIDGRLQDVKLIEHELAVAEQVEYYTRRLYPIPDQAGNRKARRAAMANARRRLK